MYKAYGLVRVKAGRRESQSLTLVVDADLRALSGSLPPPHIPCIPRPSPRTVGSTRRCIRSPSRTWGNTRRSTRPKTVGSTRKCIRFPSRTAGNTRKSTRPKAWSPALPSAARSKSVDADKCCLRAHVNCCLLLYAHHGQEEANRSSTWHAHDSCV